MLSSLSAFFPCYNEQDNLPDLVSQACHFLPSVAKKFEIIIIDDGSRDQTRKVAMKLQKNCPELRVISHPKNLGYGAALKTGITNARYEWIFWTDGDLQFNITSLQSFLNVTKKYNAVIGYRAHRADTLTRKIYGELYTQLINFLFHLGVRDIDCAFKLVRSEKIRAFSIETSGMFTSAEILVKLKKNTVVYKQIPVPHFPRVHGHSTGANPEVIIKGLREIFRFYLSNL